MLTIASLHYLTCDSVLLAFCHHVTNISTPIGTVQLHVSIFLPPPPPSHTHTHTHTHTHSREGSFIWHGRHLIWPNKMWPLSIWPRQTAGPWWTSLVCRSTTVVPQWWYHNDTPVWYHSGIIVVPQWYSSSTLAVLQWYKKIILFLSLPCSWASRDDRVTRSHIPWCSVQRPHSGHPRPHSHGGWRLFIMVMS